ncbi:MAG: hypothetical protein Q4P14_01115 [Methanobacteriaceae archaeon]|nr:hypothetical protein [Methanobacteriaceae archaeon]
MVELKYPRDKWEVNWDFLQEHYREIIDTYDVFPRDYISIGVEGGHSYLFRMMEVDPKVHDVYIQFRLEKYRIPGESDGEMNWRLFCEFLDKHPEFSGLLQLKE